VLEVIEGADDGVEVAHAGLLLVGDAPDNLRRRAGHHFDLETEFFLDSGLERFSELGARWDTENNFAFFLCGFLALYPFGLPVGLSEGGNDANDRDQRRR
jgi:hypothetical protein